MFILIVGLNHRTAPLEIRERLTFTRAHLPTALDELRAKPSITGCAILTTCNRTEIYTSVDDVEQGLLCVKDFIAKQCDFDKNDLRQYLYVKTLYDGVRHLFKVASGLDSMVLGETQVLGQVKEAYEVAVHNKATNAVLNTLFQQAISVGKRVRTETRIDQNAVSISYVAVELIKQVYGKLDEKTVLVLGAGEMSRLTAKHLLANGVSTIMVSNRSYQRAALMAKEFSGKAVRFDDLFQHMKDADIVISATGAAHYIIHPEEIMNVISARNHKPLLLVDIAVPRDIDPKVAAISDVTLYDIDQLQNVVDKNLEEREKKALAAEEIIEEEMGNFFKWLSTLFVIPTIVALQKKAECIKNKELQRAQNRLGHFSKREEKVISSMANSIVKQLLHEPIMNLKDYATTSRGHLYSEVCQNLFNLNIVEKRSGDKCEGHFRDKGQPACCMADEMGTTKVKRA